MSAELYVCPEVPAMSWEEFKTSHPVGSIALDGYVSGGPVYDPVGPYLNVNHHEDVDRLATRSTAQQVLVKARMGLDRPFTKDGVFAPNIYVNDCDQDVCAAWFLLDNITQAKNPSPSLNRFVEVAGMLDVTAGAFPYDPNLKIMSELAWVFEPYTLFKASGEMANNDSTQYRSVIDSVGARIQQHLMGRGGEAKLDTRCEIKDGGKDWKIIKETGKDGRVGALMRGVDAYVSAQELGNERWRYSVGRRSELIPFPVLDLLKHLDEAEANPDEHWGGSGIIGGSPRVGASKLSPDQVQEIINDYLETTAE